MGAGFNPLDSIIDSVVDAFVDALQWLGLAFSAVLAAVWHSHERRIRKLESGQEEGEDDTDDVRQTTEAVRQTVAVLQSKVEHLEKVVEDHRSESRKGIDRIITRLDELMQSPRRRP